MKQIITHTPSWVVGVLLCLILLGLTQLRDRTLSLTRVILLPLIMVILSFIGVLSTFGTSMLLTIVWLVALLITSATCGQFAAVKNMQFNEQSNKYSLPGSVWPLFVIMAIFVTKSGVAVAIKLQPALLELQSLQVTLAGLMGCFSGYFFARVVMVIKLKQRPLPE